jgi:hypothetical protein
MWQNQRRTEQTDRKSTELREKEKNRDYGPAHNNNRGVWHQVDTGLVGV